MTGIFSGVTIHDSIQDSFIPDRDSGGGATKNIQISMGGYISGDVVNEIGGALMMETSEMDLQQYIYCRCQ